MPYNKANRGANKHTVRLVLPSAPIWLPCWVFLSLILHGALFPPLAHWTRLFPPLVPHPSLLLCLSLASPNSLQANTHCQLFLLLSNSDLTGEHSCPATISHHGLYCLRPFPLSSSATTLLPFLVLPFFLSIFHLYESLVSSCFLMSPVCSSSNSLPPQEKDFLYLLLMENPSPWNCHFI